LLTDNNVTAVKGALRKIGGALEPPYEGRPEGGSGFFVVDQPVDAQAGSNGHAGDFLDCDYISL